MMLDQLLQALKKIPTVNAIECGISARIGVNMRDHGSADSVITVAALVNPARSDSHCANDVYDCIRRIDLVREQILDSDRDSGFHMTDHDAA